MDKHLDEHILQTQLAAYAAEGLTPLHMPGHKRRIAPAPGLPYAWDVTEVPGADNLHYAEGILREAMQRTAALYGTARCWHLVGGSTVGLLAAIRTAAPHGGEILCARNCHKAVYHAIELCELTAHWLVPPVDSGFAVYGSITPAQVAAALTAHPNAACVVLTSPTYDGVLSDVAAIAALCHARGIPLVVDEAHGAHYMPAAAPHGWVGSAVAAGADLVVQSAHKTLPSLTQTAFLQLNGELIDPDEVERQLDVFETSSPSYPLLASLDGCTGILAAHGAELFAAWRARLTRFDAATAHLQKLKILCHGADNLQSHPHFYGFDSGKIIVNGAAAGLTGVALAELLRSEYGFETEMSCANNVLAMTSVCDAEDTLDRFAAALCAMDAAAAAAPKLPLPQVSAVLPAPGETAYTIAQAVRLPHTECPFTAAAIGKVSAEYIWAYPPGVPLLAPGETITAELVAGAEALRAAGTALHHNLAKAENAVAVLAGSEGFDLR